MQTPLHLHIPEPCHERWADMQPLADGRRHCDRCERALTDFTTMTDRDSQ